MVDIFDFINYRQFLIRIYEDKKAINSSFTMTAFSNFLGFKSHNAFSKLIKGAIDLNPDKALLLAKKISLSEKETFFFILMVYLKKSKEKDLRSIILEQMERLKQEARQPQQTDKYRFSPIHNLVKNMTHHQSPSQIYEFIGASKIEDILEIRNLLKSDATDAATNVYSKLSDPKEIKSYFEETLKLSEKALASSVKKNDFYFVCLTLSPSKLEEVKQILKDSLNRISSIACEKSNLPKHYALNLQMIDWETVL